MGSFQLVSSFKMPFSSTHFNRNQRVWVAQIAYQSAYCFGKFRGEGRYIHAWVRWDSRKKDAPIIQEFEVDKEFEERIYRWTC